MGMRRFIIGAMGIITALILLLSPAVMAKEKTKAKAKAGRAMSARAMGAFLGPPDGATPEERMMEELSRRYCLNASGGSNGRLKKCAENEKKAKGRLKARKKNPAAVAYCKKVTGGSYVMLEACIDSLESSKAQVENKSDAETPRGRR